MSTPILPTTAAYQVQLISFRPCGTLHFPSNGIQQNPRVHSMILNCITDIVDDSSSVVSLDPDWVADKSTYDCYKTVAVSCRTTGIHAPSTNLAAEKVETTKKYKKSCGQGGGSADHDFYIALITNNDSFKIWISEIETKKVGISLKKNTYFCAFFVVSGTSRVTVSLHFPYKRPQKFSPAAGFFFKLAFFFIFPDPSLSGTVSRKSSISMRAP